MKNGYTDTEWDRMLDIINDVPAEFYGDRNDADWENLIMELAAIVEGKRTRAVLSEVQPKTALPTL